MHRSSIVIPVFNQAALTDSCIRAIGEGDFEIIVVDDASTDHTATMLKALGHRVRTVTHVINQGFATSCNHGAAVASGEFLVFLNNDTIPEPGWLEALVDYADRHPEASVVGSKLLYPDSTIQHAGVVICQDHYPRHIYSGFPANHPAVSKPRRFQIVTAACMLVRRSAFGKLGGFDAAFRNGFEDVDFCLRLGQTGHEIHYCPDSVVQHLESVSPGRFKHDHVNVGLYRDRWWGRVQPDDVKYYLEDDLLRLNYEGRYPVHFEISPLLGSLDGACRQAQIEGLLDQRNRQVVELSRENTQLRLELGKSAESSATGRYDRLRGKIQEVVSRVTPTGAKVMVVSKGDGALLDFPKREGWHFPQNSRGVYAGYHPADSAEAIEHLEDLRAKGAQYLVIPGPSLWWLDHYADFRRHLETHYAPVESVREVCTVYALSSNQALASCLEYGR